MRSGLGFCYFLFTFVMATSDSEALADDLGMWKVHNPCSTNISRIAQHEIRIQGAVDLLHLRQGKSYVFTVTGNQVYRGKFLALDFEIETGERMLLIEGEQRQYGLLPFHILSISEL